MSFLPFPRMVSDINFPLEPTVYCAGVVILMSNFSILSLRLCLVGHHSFAPNGSDKVTKTGSPACVVLALNALALPSGIPL
ncbi:hypothetical protein D3C86_1658650 [compost metagenome]